MILDYIIIGLILDITAHKIVEMTSKGKYVYHGEIFVIISIMLYMFK